MENADLVRRLRSVACAALLAAPAAVALAQEPVLGPPPRPSSRRMEPGGALPPPTPPQETPPVETPPAAAPTSTPTPIRTPSPALPPLRDCGAAGCAAPACRSPWAPPRPQPSPYGTFITGWRQAQVARAEESRLTFFSSEWFAGGAKLGPFGRDHLAEVAMLLRATPQPVVIAPAVVDIQSDDDLDAAYARAAELDAARRRQVADGLERAGVADARSLVRTARPLAEGLDGNEAPRVYRGLITSQSGQGAGGGGGGGGATGINGGFGGGGGISTGR